MCSVDLMLSVDCCCRTKSEKKLWQQKKHLARRSKRQSKQQRMPNRWQKSLKHLLKSQRSWQPKCVHRLMRCDAVECAMPGMSNLDVVQAQEKADTDKQANRDKLKEMNKDMSGLQRQMLGDGGNKAKLEKDAAKYDASI